MYEKIVEAFGRRVRGKPTEDILLDIEEARQICYDPDILEMMEQDPNAWLVLRLDFERQYASYTVARYEEIANSPFDDFADGEEFDELVGELLALAQKKE